MISAIEISNFKCIKKAKVELPRFGVLIGVNGAGKTTLFYAIELIAKLANGGDLNDAINLIAPFAGEVFFDGQLGKPSRFKIRLKSSDDAEYIYELSFSFSSQARTGRLRGFYISDEKLQRCIDGALVFSRDNEGIYDGDGEKVPLKVEAAKLAVASYVNPEVIAVSSSLSSSVILRSRFSEGEAKIINPSIKDDDSIDALAVRLKEDDQKLFTLAMKRTSEVIPEFEEPEIIDFSRMEKSADNKTEKVKKFFVTWKDKTVGSDYTNVSLSDGNYRTIYTIVSLFTASKGSLVGVEEIENGMHLGRIKRLIDIIRTTCKTQKVQILLTTHSDQILNQIMPEEVIYCSRNKEGSSYIALSETEEYKAIKDELKGAPTGKDVFDTGAFNI
jgi:predicted ATPase